MIKINLLRQEINVERRQGPRGPALMLLAVPLITLLAVGVFVYSFNTNLAQMKKEVDKNKTLISELQKKIGAAKKYEALNKDLQQKSSLIQVLSKNQAVPVMLLDQVSKLVPAGVWLNTIGYMGNAVNIEGTAFTNLDIVNYVENLKREETFMDVYLQESKQADVEKVEVYKFKLNFKIKV